MTRAPSRSDRLLVVALLALTGAACAGGSTFVRPQGVESPVITDEATGRTFSDCREAFAQATGETVLTFSAGVFRCDPEIVVRSAWLVVRGAGMGRTFLETGPAGEVPKLAAIRPGRVLRVQDLAFGGLTPMPSPEARAELVRVAVATDRPALFGDERSGVVGSVFVVHSVLSARTGPKAPNESQPRPVSFDGNDRVALVESVLVDVEQEFELFPAPGSVVLLSEGLEGAFSRHEPAARRRPRASSRENVACGHPKSPRLRCASSSELDDLGGDPVFEAAALVESGRPLESIESLLREAGKAFADRFRTRLGPFIRQPDVFWFDDLWARRLEEESSLAGRASVAVLADFRSKEIVATCGQGGVPMTTVLALASSIDRLLPTPTAEAACREKLQARSAGALESCGEGWAWEQLLKTAGDADAALGGGTNAATCRAKLAERTTAAATTAGPLGKAYLAEVARALRLEVAPPAGANATLEALLAKLPWIVTKTGRDVGDDTTLFGRALKAATTPDSGDGRRLVEMSPPCRLVLASPGSNQMKAVGTVTLALAAHADDEPEVAFELPVEATHAHIPRDTPAGGINVALVKACEDRQAERYPAAVRGWLLQELSRLAREGAPELRADAEVLLFAGRDERDSVEPMNVPFVPDALARVAALARQARTITSNQPEMNKQEAAVSAAVLASTKEPPAWSARDVAFSADLLSRAGVVDTATCAFLLPNVPWRDEQASIAGEVILDGVSTLVRCRPDPRGFELSFWVTGEAANRMKVLAILDGVLTGKLGRHINQNTVVGPAKAWPFAAGMRTGFVFASVPPADQMLGYVLVPLRSNWTNP